MCAADTVSPVLFPTKKSVWFPEVLVGENRMQKFLSVSEIQGPVGHFDLLLTTIAQKRRDNA